MKFHYMNRENSKPEHLAAFANKLNRYGVSSILLTYHSNKPDFLLTSLAAANNDIKIKFMIAIRTYAISPEYLAMMCRSYNSLFPDKIMLNIVSGDIHDDETSIDDIVQFRQYLDTPEKRVFYTRQWLEKFIQISSKWHTPEIVMGGHSDLTQKTAKEFSVTHLSMLDQFLEKFNRKNKIINNKQMVAFCIVIRNSDEEAEDFAKNNSFGGSSFWTIAGSEDTVMQKINNLQRMGVTDILVFENPFDEEHQRVLTLIKKINKG